MDCLRMEVEDEYYLVIFPRLATRIPINLLSSHPIGVACDRIATTTSAERLELLQVSNQLVTNSLKR